MKKSTRLSLLALAAFLILSVTWSHYHKSTQTNWVTIKRGPIVSAIYGLGTVTSDKVYHLKVGVPTSVHKLYVHEGDNVKAGQPLVQFNGLPVFTAAFDGTVTSLSLNEHETVYPNTELLTLMDLTDCYILVSLEQEAAVKINKGQKVKLSFSGLPNQTFTGVVSTIYPKDQESYVKIIVNKLPQSILPQMSSDVAIILEEKNNVLLIPAQSVQNSTVTIRHQGKTEKLPIELGAINDELAEVVSNNLQNGDQILVKA